MGVAMESLPSSEMTPDLGLHFELDRVAGGSGIEEGKSSSEGGAIGIGESGKSRGSAKEDTVTAGLLVGLFVGTVIDVL
jgi:hypothetical protein